MWRPCCQAGQQRIRSWRFCSSSGGANTRFSRASLVSRCPQAAAWQSSSESPWAGISLSLPEASGWQRPQATRGLISRARAKGTLFWAAASSSLSLSLQYILMQWPGRGPAGWFELADAACLWCDGGLWFAANGREKVVGIKNEGSHQILVQARRLRNSSGRKVVKLRSRHWRKDSSIQGIWSPATQQHLS